MAERTGEMTILKSCPQGHMSIEMVRDIRGCPKSTFRRHRGHSQKQSGLLSELPDCFLLRISQFAMTGNSLFGQSPADMIKTNLLITREEGVSKASMRHSEVTVDKSINHIRRRDVARYVSTSAPGASRNFSGWRPDF
jgi:hypothetical protein